MSGRCCTASRLHRSEKTWQVQNHMEGGTDPYVISVLEVRFSSWDVRESLGPYALQVCSVYRHLWCREPVASAPETQASSRSKGGNSPPGVEIATNIPPIKTRTPVA